MNRPMSPRLYGSLWHFLHNEMTMTQLGNVHQGTLAAMCKRGWLERARRIDGVTVYRITRAGREEYASYEAATLSTRQKPGPVTEYALGLLAVVRLGRKVA